PNGPSPIESTLTAGQHRPASVQCTKYARVLQSHHRIRATPPRKGWMGQWWGGAGSLSACVLAGWHRADSAEVVDWELRDVVSDHAAEGEHERTNSGAVAPRAR